MRCRPAMYTPCSCRDLKSVFDVVTGAGKTHIQYKMCTISLCLSVCLPACVPACVPACLPASLSLSLYYYYYVFKAYKNLAPPYLKQLFILSNIRATSRIDLFKTSFSFSGASLWNTIPNQIKSCNSLTSFKTQLYKWIRSRLL